MESAKLTGSNLIMQAKTHHRLLLTSFLPPVASTDRPSLHPRHPWILVGQGVSSAAAVIRSRLKTTFGSDHGVSRKFPSGRVPANTCARAAPGTDGLAGPERAQNAECRIQ